MDFISIVFILFLMAIINAAVFHILLNGSITFKDAVKLTVVAVAVNKFLFTGTGYVASSYLSQDKKVEFHRTISAFLLLEFLVIFLWLVLGVGFGAKLAFRVPIVVFSVVVFFSAALWFNRNKVLPLIKKVWFSLKDMGSRIPIVIPFIFGHMALFTFYYIILFKKFGFTPDAVTAIRIVAISYALGYLSPSPAGVGFKDTGLVLLLMEQNVSLNNAISLAVLDRVIITVFWGILGCFLGFDVMRAEFIKRFKRNKQ